MGGSRMTATDSLNLKDKMLDPNTAVFTVQPIEWIGSTEIWDGRENLGDKATPSTIAHFRRTLGVRFGVTSASRPLVTDIELVPNSDLSNYESILYTKYLQDKYDQASYVYIPAGGVFKNPSVLRGLQHKELGQQTMIWFLKMSKAMHTMNLTWPELLCSKET